MSKKVVKKSDKKLSPCPECKKEFKNLSVHMRVHQDGAVKKEDKTPEKDTSSDAKLDQVLRGIDTLAGAVGKLVELQTADKGKGDGALDVSDSKETKFNASLDDETYPKNYVPKNFRKLVDEILSPDFGLVIEDFPDRTDFMVNIIVPEKYSSVKKVDRDKGIEDIRSRMVSRALGENGVREWCKLVRLNLSKFYSAEGIQSPFTGVIV